jgi:hypothetical protein
LRGILTGLVVAAICWAVTQLGRLFDLAARQKWATTSSADRVIVKACFGQLASIVTIATRELSPLINLPLVCDGCNRFGGHLSELLGCSTLASGVPSP